MSCRVVSWHVVWSQMSACVFINKQFQHVLTTGAVLSQPDQAVLTARPTAEQCAENGAKSKANQRAHILDGHDSRYSRHSRHGVTSCHRHCRHRNSMWHVNVCGRCKIMCSAAAKSLAANDDEKNKMQPTNPNAHTYVNGTDVKTHGYAITQNTFLQ